jgi:hypothetical protein
MEPVHEPDRIDQTAAHVVIPMGFVCHSRHYVPGIFIGNDIGVDGGKWLVSDID